MVLSFFQVFNVALVYLPRNPQNQNQGLHQSTVDLQPRTQIIQALVQEGRLSRICSC